MFTPMAGGGDEGPHKVTGRDAKRGRRTEGSVSVEATIGI